LDRGEDKSCLPFQLALGKYCLDILANMISDATVRPRSSFQLHCRSSSSSNTGD